MSLTIRTSDHVIAARQDQPDAWRSIGADPFFTIRYTLARKPFLVVFLHGKGETLDPSAFIDRGGRFHARDSVTLPKAESLVITADVGPFGWNRSLRIDPATFACEFLFSVEAFETRQEAERAIQARMKIDMADAVRFDLGRLPRFRVRFLPFGKEPLTEQIRRFAESSATLASRLPATPPDGDDAVWLSIVVPVYDASPEQLDELRGSFDSQDVPGIELVLSDDASPSSATRRWLENAASGERIKTIFSADNRGISGATNAGIAQASGKWVALLDHDDVIAPHAVRVIANAIRTNPEAQFLYTDELIVNGRLKPIALNLKPAYDPVLLSGVNYINHFSIYRRDRLNEVGGLRSEFDGSQDYDLLLRYLKGVPDDRIMHVPYPAYWWRHATNSYSQRFLDKATAAARKAIGERYSGEDRHVSVGPALTATLHRVEFQQTEWPKISVIIPSRDHFDLISTVLKGLFEKTDYPSIEVIVVDNGTTDQRVLDLYDDYTKRHDNFTAHIRQEPFNFARSINRGLSVATGDHVLLLNNDVEVIDAGWLKEMVSCLNFDATGIVGAKLLFPDDTIQHAGVIVGLGRSAGHWYSRKPAHHRGPMNRLHLRNALSCVTGAVMLISGECVRQVGPWDEDHFAVAFNDVDFCMRAGKAGFRIIWTPFACLYHHESVSRGYDRAGDARKRFRKERDNLLRIHGTETFDDPAINPGYGRQHTTPQLSVPTELPPARPGAMAKSHYHRES